MRKFFNWLFGRTPPVRTDWRPGDYVHVTAPGYTGTAEVVSGPYREVGHYSGREMVGFLVRYCDHPDFGKRKVRAVLAREMRSIGRGD